MLDLIVLEGQFDQGKPKDDMDRMRKRLTTNVVQHRMLVDCGIERFYYNSEGFKGDPGINQPASSPKHIPYLEAIVGAVYKSQGLGCCEEWVRRVVIP